MQLQSRATTHLEESVVLIRWLANLTHRVAAETKTEHDRMRAALFLAMASMRKIFSDGGLILDESSLKKAAYSCGVYFDALYWLANEAIANKQVLWKIRPKCHQQLGFNPCIIPCTIGG